MQYCASIVQYISKMNTFIIQYICVQLKKKTSETVYYLPTPKGPFWKFSPSHKTENRPILLECRSHSVDLKVPFVQWYFKMANRILFTMLHIILSAIIKKTNKLESIFHFPSRKGQSAFCSSSIGPEGVEKRNEKFLEVLQATI